MTIFQKKKKKNAENCKLNRFLKTFFWKNFDVIFGNFGENLNVGEMLSKFMGNSGKILK